MESEYGSVHREIDFNMKKTSSCCEHTRYIMEHASTCSGITEEWASYDTLFALSRYWEVWFLRPGMGNSIMPSILIPYTHSSVENTFSTVAWDANKYAPSAEPPRILQCLDGCTQAQDPAVSSHKDCIILERIE